MPLELDKARGELDLKNDAGYPKVGMNSMEQHCHFILACSLEHIYNIDLDVLLEVDV